MCRPPRGHGPPPRPLGLSLDLFLYQIHRLIVPLEGHLIVANVVLGLIGLILDGRAVYLDQGDRGRQLDLSVLPDNLRVADSCVYVVRCNLELLLEPFSPLMSPNQYSAGLPQECLNPWNLPSESRQIVFEYAMPVLHIVSRALGPRREIDLGDDGHV